VYNNKPVSRTNSVSFTLSMYAGYFYKIGKIGMIYYQSAATNWTAGTAKTLFTLPSDMYPTGTTSFMGFANSSDYTYAYQIQVSTAGVVTATPNKAGSNVRVSFIYNYPLV